MTTLSYQEIGALIDLNFLNESELLASFSAGLQGDNASQFVTDKFNGLSPRQRMQWHDKVEAELAN